MASARKAARSVRRTAASVPRRPAATRAACGQCGNGSCDAEVSCDACPEDCGQCNPCGDGVCGALERCDNCPRDCGQCQAVCGDGLCQFAAGESCDTCFNDCGNPESLS